MKFEEWFKVYRPSLDTSVIESEFIYEAGVQSRQDEIDEQFVANCKQTDHIHKLQRERDALQKRIDELEAKQEGFVLVPLTRETAVAIEQKVEQQLEASGITADPFHLDGWAILDAISAVEVQNGLD